MPASLEYKDYIPDRLSLVEDVTPRTIFGGLIFRILGRMDRIYLRMGDINRPDFEAPRLYRSGLIKEVR